MLKANANYRMSKQAKRLLATIVDPQQRADFKRSTIQSELSAAIQPRREKNRKENREE